MCRIANGLLTGAPARGGKRRASGHKTELGTACFQVLPLGAAVDKLGLLRSSPPPPTLENPCYRAGVFFVLCRLSAICHQNSNGAGSSIGGPPLR
jgi:hypothetical protein